MGERSAPIRLSVPEPAEAAAFYVDVLGFRRSHVTAERAVLVGYGTELTLERGRGEAREAPPAPGQQAAALTIPLERVEAAWERDRAADPERTGPQLDERGTFVYATLDPGGNGLTLLTPLPRDESEGRSNEQITQRLKPPHLD